MFEFFTLTDTIVLKSEFLNSNLLNHLNESVKEEKIGKCIEKYGYIISIDNLEIKSAAISPADCSNRFVVSYKIKSLLPKIGDVFEGKSIITTIEQNDFHGALINVFEIQKKDNITIPVQVFITNGMRHGTVFVFKNCGCSINCAQLPAKCLLNNILVEYITYKDGVFRITGLHVH